MGGAIFERGPDRRWLVGAAGPAVAVDGAIALADGGRSRIGSESTPMSLVLFETAEALVSRRIQLPDDADCARLALGRHWAVVAGFGKTAILVHRTDGRVLRLEPPTHVEDVSCTFGFDPETDELLVLEGHTRISRFALQRKLEKYGIELPETPE